MGQPARQRFTYEEYLRLEERSTVKHEFLDGHAWAMAGGTPEHAAICVNVAALLSAQLRDRSCRVYSSDLRVRVQATGLATYPDVTVICERFEADPDDAKGHTAVNPRVLVEVLSESTAEYDRGEKLAQYQRIDSLAEVALVACDEQRIEVWRRAADRSWAREEYRGSASARLASLACELPLAEVYRNPLPQR